MKMKTNRLSSRYATVMTSVLWIFLAVGKHTDDQCLTVVSATVIGLCLDILVVGVGHQTDIYPQIDPSSPKTPTSRNFRS